MPEHNDTICALATPAGKGGIGVVRVSGKDALRIAGKVLGFQPQPRHAHYAAFLDAEGTTLDMGIALSFPGPDSFTGEDVIEFQAHGGPFVLDMLLREVLRLGARLARPGEFSERAFLNDKIDLAQAEAIADLIDSHSEAASRFAMKSLQGEFSALINKLLRSITDLRIYIEAAIDFPEEEIDFLSSGHVVESLQGIQKELQDVLAQARLGSIMKEGLSVVIAGEPNAGKSSLLNLLAGQNRAIVTEIAGTTRDLLREHISIDGLPLNIIDTAGLRESNDPVEQEGIRRAWDEIKKADLILLIRDSNIKEAVQASALWQQLSTTLPDTDKLLVIDNKIDLSGLPAGTLHNDDSSFLTLRLSVKSGAGVDDLRKLLKQKAGFSGSEEGGFIARRRHLDALQRAQQALAAASEQLQTHKAGELMAEDLRLAQNCLSEITGKFSSDDLLGEIFASFCIGK